MAYLALHPRPQLSGVLADLLWPDDARHSLRMELSSLGTQLEKPDYPPLLNLPASILVCALTRFRPMSPNSIRYAQPDSSI